MGVLKNDVGRPSNKTIMIRNILKGILLIVVIAVFFVGGYLLNDYQNKDTNKQNKDDKTVINNEKTKELNIYSEEVRNLYSPFSISAREATTDQELYNRDKTTTNDLSYEYKNRLAFAKYYNEVGQKNLYEGVINIDELGEVELDYLKSSTLEKSYKNLFGENIKYMAKSFDSSVIDTLAMTYDKNKDFYIADMVGGDCTGYRYGKELYKAIQAGNKIELYEYVVVYNEDDETGIVGVYSNIEDANNFKNPIKQIRTYDGYSCAAELIKHRETNGYMVEDLSDYKDKASKYKLTFEKENGNYVFRQIEKIK